MKKMLKLSLFLAVLSLVFVSCSGGGGRDDEPSNFYVKFKVNGVQKEFRAGLLAEYKYHKTRKITFVWILAEELFKTLIPSLLR